MYSTAWCGYCQRARNLLERKGVAVREIKVDEDPGEREAMLQKTGGRRTVPQIFIGERMSAAMTTSRRWIARANWINCSADRQLKHRRERAQSGRSASISALPHATTRQRIRIMADEVPAPNGQAADPNAPQFAPQAVYVKDVSFEAPAGPRVAPNSPIRRST